MIYWFQVNKWYVSNVSEKWTAPTQELTRGAFLIDRYKTLYWPPFFHNCSTLECHHLHVKDSTSASRKDVLGIQWGHLYSLESREGKRNYSYIDRSKIYFWLIFSCLSYNWVVDTYKVVTNIAFWMKKLFVAGSVVRLIFAHRKLHKKALSSISWFNWRMLIYTNIIFSYTSYSDMGLMQAKHLKHSGCQTEPIQLRKRPWPIGLWHPAQVLLHK